MLRPKKWGSLIFTKSQTCWKSSCPVALTWKTQPIQHYRWLTHLDGVAGQYIFGYQSKIPKHNHTREHLCFQYYCYYHRIIIINTHRNENTAPLRFFFFFEKIKKPNPKVFIWENQEQKYPNKHNDWVAHRLEMCFFCTPQRGAPSVSCWLLVTQPLTSLSLAAAAKSL